MRVDSEASNGASFENREDQFVYQRTRLLDLK
jgi:hypothetical protein